MPDLLSAAIERLDTIRSTLVTFGRRNDISLIEDAQEEIEELHDELDEIIEEYDD